ncbi:MAG: methylmalonyl-CoA mutase family protein [Flavobacteriales bacterium]|nr:methylmalonyl-CoA mutase family protein [Flavobacteriales bacterium]
MQDVFSDFDTPNPKQWWDEVKKQLLPDGTPSSLLTPTAENILVQPMYFASEQEINVPIPANLKSATLYQPAYADNPVLANQTIREGITQGADAIWITAATLPDENDWQTLMKDLPLARLNLAFDFGESNPSVIFQLITHYKQHAIPEKNRTGAVWFAPLSMALQMGHNDYSPQRAERFYRTTFDSVQADLPGYRFLHALPYHHREAGANLVQELALGLSEMATYLDWFTDWGYSPQDVAARMQMVLGVGSDYFMEMAKFRTARILTHRLLTAWSEEIAPVPIMAMTLMRNKSMYDIHTNLLRASTEALSVLIGGCDALCVRPYTETWGLPDEQALRLARNIPWIIRHEAYVDMVQDPAAGAYYINELTNQLTEKSWQLFLDLEAMGGFEQAMIKGAIQKMVTAQDEKEKEAFRQMKRIMVGTNKYPLKEEKISRKISQAHANIFLHPEADFTPLTAERLSQKLDEVRMKTESSEN